MKKLLTVIFILLFATPAFGASISGVIMAGTGLDATGSGGGGAEAVVEDDMQTDNTGDWNKADCTLAFDDVNKHYEINRTAGTQTIYQQDSVSFVNGVYYKAMFDIKDGTAASVTVSLLVGDTFYGADVLDGEAVSTNEWVTHTFYFTASATTDSVCFSSDFASGNYELKNFSIVSEGYTCTGTGDSCVGQDDGLYNVGYDSDTKWSGGIFIADATATLCTVTLRLKEIGVYTGDFTVCIFSDNAGKPNTSLGCAYVTRDGDDIPSSTGDVEFTGLDVDVTLGTTYHVVGWSSTVSTDNYVQWAYEDDDCSADGEETTRSADGITWNTRSGARAFEFTTKKLE